VTSERLAPDTILTQTNLTGAVTDIDDDPDAPDGLWLIASGNNVNTAVSVAFPSPTVSPTAGADLQEFRAQVREFDTGQTGTPTARIELWENGALVRAGPDFSVIVQGQIIAFTWDANELSFSDGSLVECRVVGTKSGGSPSSRNTVEVGAVEWNAEVSAAGSSLTINGAVTVAPSISAATAFDQHPALFGAVTVTPQVAATLDHTLNAALAGAVTLAASIGAAMVHARNTAIGGAVVATPAVAAVLAFTRHPALAGAVTVTPGVASALGYTLKASLPGAATVTPSVASGMAYQGGNAIVGDITVAPSVAALLAHNVHPALAGSLTLGSAIGAALAYSAPGGSGIAGLVTVTPGVAAGLARNVHRRLPDGVALGITPAALGMIHGGAGSIVARTDLAGEVRLSEMAGASGPIKLTGEVA
jgi:hypothetical protein